jgi:Protease inhibitor Inh
MMNPEGIIHMTITRSLIALAVFAAAAQAADVAGDWKLAVGAQPPCVITLSADGAATGDCATGNRVARWRAAADKLELRTASGETVGILTAKDGSYAGKRFSDGKTMVLSR